MLGVAIHFEMRDLERADGPDRCRNGDVCLTATSAAGQAAPHRPQGAQNLCPVESLSRAVFAVAHRLGPTFVREYSAQMRSPRRDLPAPQRTPALRHEW